MKMVAIESTAGFRRAGGAVSGTILLAVTISISTAACGLFNSSPVQQRVVPRPPAKEAESYQIGRDDELEIIVWNQPQLSGKAVVSADGTIAMPLIGRVPASGLTPDQLKAQLEKRYARYVHDANITVRVSDAASHVFYVLGSVNKPGAYKLHSGEVLSQALAEAGGFAEFADPGKIRILRHKETETV